MLFAIFILMFAKSISVECAKDNLPRNIAYDVQPVKNPEMLENPNLLSKMFGNLLMRSLFHQEDLIQQDLVQHETDFKQKHKILKLLIKQNDKDFFRF